MKKKFIIALSLFLPVLSVFAGVRPGGVTPSNTYAGALVTISQVVERLQNILNLILPFIVGLTVLMIIYGIFGFVTNPADEEARGKAKGYIIWGIIAVFIMVSVWGLVNILYNSFLTDPFAGQELPINATVPVVPSGTAF